jgi:hypothetical protein
MSDLDFFPPPLSPEKTAESNLRKLKDGGLMVHFMLDPVEVRHYCDPRYRSELEAVALTPPRWPAVRDFLQSC